MRRRILILVGALWVAGCTASTGASVVDTEAPQFDRPAAAGSLPVDSSLTPISRSDPGPEAKAALSLCGLDGGDPRIVGAAKLPSSEAIPTYAPVKGPELGRTAEPAWLFQLKGDYVGRRFTYVDPTCAVIDGDPYMYVSNGKRVDGKQIPVPPVENPPTMALPPMVP